MAITDTDIAGAFETLPVPLTMAEVEPAEPPEADQPQGELPDQYDEEQLLRIVGDERRRSIGFGDEDDGALTSDREMALNYYKGVMTDMPAGQYRSGVVSTDLAEAVETVLPDLVDIFTGGEDVATFQPTGAEDEEAAAQETDYVNHVVFNENPGFLTLYSMFKDALLQKTGLVKFWREDQDPEVQEEVFTGKDAAELQFATAAAEQGGLELLDLTPAEDGTFGFRLSKVTPRGRVRIAPVPPEDFTIAANATSLTDTHYCAMRARPLVQELIADGYDRDSVEELPAYGSDAEIYTTEQARDTAGEHTRGEELGGTGDMRVVEVVEHYIRLINDDDQLELWKVVTGANERKLLRKDGKPACERINSVPFGAVTPYLTPHRFYGRSLADLLIEIQRIKTALTRMAMDNGYFALNQRYEVATADGRAGRFTLMDLANNAPGVAVRSLDGNSVRPISGGGLNFDAFGALEYFSTIAENRTGIVRNAQGLNPDTLHDTAKGAMALMGAAQKRIRLIARIFAETGIKQMFLGVHDLIRRGPSSAAKVRLRGKWVDVDPTQWGARNDMDVMVGLGSGGLERDMQVSQTVLALQEKLIAGGKAKFVTDANLSNALKLAMKAMRQKAPELYFSEPDPNAPPEPSPPDPKAIEAQGKAQALQMETQGKVQKAAAETQFDQQQREAQAQRDHEARMAEIAANERAKAMEIDGSLQLKRYQTDQELLLKREQLQAELMLKREQMAETNRLRAEAMKNGAHGGDLPSGGSSFGSDVEVGGDPG